MIRHQVVGSICLPPKKGSNSANLPIFVVFVLLNSRPTRTSSFWRLKDEAIAEPGRSRHA
jgi:hypothetical protein